MTRFVDDFRMFLKGTDPYDALGYLAQQLGINEGLSLNAAKTSVITRKEYICRLERLTTDLDVPGRMSALARDASPRPCYGRILESRCGRAREW